MTRLNWEKQNRSEIAKEKRRESQRTKILKAYQNGAKRERERIIKSLESELALYPDDLKTGFSFAIRTIKGEQK
jgi:hypothetical protein